MFTAFHNTEKDYQRINHWNEVTDLLKIGRKPATNFGPNIISKLKTKKDVASGYIPYLN